MFCSLCKNEVRLAVVLYFTGNGRDCQCNAYSQQHLMCWKSAITWIVWLPMKLALNCTCSHWSGTIKDFNNCTLDVLCWLGPSSNYGNCKLAYTVLFECMCCICFSHQSQDVQRPVEKDLDRAVNHQVMSVVGCNKDDTGVVMVTCRLLAMEEHRVVLTTPVSSSGPSRAAAHPLLWLDALDFCLSMLALTCN